MLGDKSLVVVTELLFILSAYEEWVLVNMVGSSRINSKIKILKLRR